MHYLLLVLLQVFSIQQDGDPLAPWRWQNRIIVVAHDASSSGAYEQISLLYEFPREIQDRHLLIFELRANEVKINGQRTNLEVRDLRKRLGVGPKEFQVLLIGKDGGIKSRYRKLTPAQVFFDHIDSMPMRQSEMRRE